VHFEKRRVANLPRCPAERQQSDCRRGGCDELRIMAIRVSELPNDVTVYLVEEDFGQRGRPI
jgi:hypothetical protein